MSTVKRIVCLANSHKNRDSCVAGKELLADGHFGKWFRPVGSGKDGAVSDRERQYDVGDEPQLLDVIDIPVLAALPEDHQQENWIVDHRTRWKRIARSDYADLMQMVDPVRPLWINGHGNANDRIPADLAHTLKDSLRLIRVDSWEIEVSQGRLKGFFRYAGENYGLRITDPVYDVYREYQSGRYPAGAAYLTISLGGPFHNTYAGSWDCYKLIAAVLSEGTFA